MPLRIRLLKDLFQIPIGEIHERSGGLLPKKSLESWFYEDKIPTAANAAVLASTIRDIVADTITVGWLYPMPSKATPTTPNHKPRDGGGPQNITPRNRKRNNGEAQP